MAVIIESGFVGIEYPLDHPRIGWNTVVNGTATASSSATGFAASNAADPRTFTAWRPTAFPATWTLTFGGNRVVSYLAIGAHDLGSSGCEVVVQEPDGGGWADIPGTSHVPSDDSAIMFLLSPRSIGAIRIRITDPGSAALPTIGHVRSQDVMEWPQRAQFTGKPITEARQIEYEFNQSQTGEWLGQTVKRRGLAFDANISHLSEDWTDNTYAPFRNHADAGLPFFYAARPSKYADEVAYCMAESIVQSERAIGNKNISRSVSMALRGFARNG